IWILRGLLACEEIRPKAELLGLSCAGAENVTRLVTLKNSKRSCRKRFSPRLNRFRAETSRFLVGSRRRLLKYVLKVRTWLASCAFDAVMKRVVSNAGPSG